MAKERVCRIQFDQVEKDAKNPPNPLMCKEGKGVRHFSCQFYDLCLDKAAKGMWSGFTCRECSWHLQKEDDKPS